MAIPILIEAFNLSGAIMMIDAMETQHDIVQAIIDAGADYVSWSRTASRGWRRTCETGSLRFNRVS